MIIQDGEVLLTRRPAPPLRDRNEFPGGHREPGESLEECVVREVREETALEVVCGELLDFQDVEVSWGHLQLSFFECRLEKPGQIPANTEHQPRWVPIEDLPNLELPVPNQPLVEQLLRSRRTPDPPESLGAD